MCHFKSQSQTKIKERVSSELFCHLFFTIFFRSRGHVFLYIKSQGLQQPRPWSNEKMIFKIQVVLKFQLLYETLNLGV